MEKYKTYVLTNKYPGLPQGDKCRVDFATFRHVKPKLTTNDGVDLYQGDIFWEVRGNNSYINSVHLGRISDSYEISDITYSTKQLAQDHLDHHKPKFSEAHVKMACKRWGANYNLFLEMLKDVEKKV